MQAAYRLELTDEYLKEAQRLAIAQNAGLRLIYQNQWIQWSPRVALAGAMVYFVVERFWSTAVMMGGALALLLLASLLKIKSLDKARRNHPMKGSVMTAALDQEGLNTVGPHSNANIRWLGVLRAIAYPHGVLLKMKTRGLIWLPDLSLTEASPADARKLVAEHVEEYVVAAK